VTSASEAHDVAAALAALRARIVAAAQRAGRDPAQIVLVGVAKGQPASRVAEAVAAGLAHVGESFAQEAREEIPRIGAQLARRGVAPPRWHFVGRLQRNKARLVAALFECVESLDRADLARELSARAAALGRTLEVLLQVNISGERQKGGAAPEALAELLGLCATLPALRVAGLMAVPAASEDAETARPAFARLRALREELRAAPGGEQLRELSMGMSADFEVAIEEGATRVRVGSALFGPREDLA
jgi:pyridoxal phosphate enzyme (YggS family)